jgi:hypothetical protein
MGYTNLCELCVFFVFSVVKKCWFVGLARVCEPKCTELLVCFVDYANYDLSESLKCKKVHRLSETYELASSTNSIVEQKSLAIRKHYSFQIFLIAILNFFISELIFCFSDFSHFSAIPNCKLPGMPRDFFVEI